MKKDRSVDIEKYFDTFIWDGGVGGFIYNDVTRSISVGLNFLSAMALMVYTEFLGGLIPLMNNLNKNANRKRFYNFLFRMGFWYEDLDAQLESVQGKDIFEIYRNGLVHEYFIKHDLRIGKVANVIARDAILSSGGEAYGLGATNDGRLLFATRNYFKHFMNVVREMRRKVIEKEDVLWVEAFCKGAKL